MLKKYLNSIGVNENTIEQILKTLKANENGEKKNIQIIEKKLKVLDWIGLQCEEMNAILEENISFFAVDINKILQALGTLYILGYYPEDVKNLLIENPTLLSKDLVYKELIVPLQEQKEEYTVDDYIKLGFNKLQYQKLKKQCKTNCDFDKINIYLRVGFLYTLGYTPWEVIKMASSCSRVISSPSTSIQKKYNALLEMGFTKESIHKMTVVHAKIYSYSSQHIENQLNNMIDLGLTKEEALHAIEIFPQILSLMWNHCLEREELFEILCRNLKGAGLWEKVEILSEGYYGNFVKIVNYVKGLIENGKN